MAYNEPAAPAAMSRIAEAMHSDHAPTAVQSLVRDLGGPTSLREIGFAEADIGRAVELAVARAYPNPREVTRAGITALLQHALNGDCGPRRYWVLAMASADSRLISSQRWDRMSCGSTIQLPLTAGTAGRAR